MMRSKGKNADVSLTAAQEENNLVNKNKTHMRLLTRKFSSIPSRTLKRCFPALFPKAH